MEGSIHYVVPRLSYGSVKLPIFPFCVSNIRLEAFSSIACRQTCVYVYVYMCTRFIPELPAMDVGCEGDIHRNVTVSFEKKEKQKLDAGVRAFEFTSAIVLARKVS